MKGIWKQQVSGTDNKGNTRKKCTYNHILKDDGNYHYHKGNQIVIYTKPLPYFVGIYSSHYTKRCQRLANRATRHMARQWLRQGNWDTPIKTHALSKSIAWCVS